MKASCLTISRESVRLQATRVDQYKIMKARHGRRAADLNLGARGGGVVTTRPLERVEVDHTLCDVHLIDERTGAVIGRPWLTLLVDHYSGVILGYHLSRDPPSSLSVLLALRHAIMPKSGEWEIPLGIPNAVQEDSTQASTDEVAGELQVVRTEVARAIPRQVVYWVTHGVPELLVSDNGKDLISRHILESTGRLGINLMHAPVMAAWFKGTIERKNGTVNTRFFHRLPGSTLGRPMSAVKYDARKFACITEAQLRRLLERHIVTIENNAPRRQNSRSPNQLFVEGLLDLPARMPTSLNDLNAAFSRTEFRDVTSTGVQYFYLNYQSDQLAAILHTNKYRAKVTLQIQLEDLRTISFVHPETGELLTAKCTRDLGEYPYSLTRHQAALGVIKRMGGNPHFDVDLSRAQLVIDKEIAELNNSQNRRAIEKRRKAFGAVLAEGAAMGHEDVDALRDSAEASAQPTQRVFSIEDVDAALETAFARRPVLLTDLPSGKEQP